MPERERRFNNFDYDDFEYRVTDDGLGVVTGTVIRYGDVANILWFTEEFRAGAFEGRMDDMLANRMHQRTQPLARSGGGLTVTDSSERMTAEVTLPDTTCGRDTSVEVAKKLLRGLSVEFKSIKDEYDYEKDHRVVIEARMYGFGIVDTPAYPDSVAKMKRWQEYRDYYYGPEPEPEPTPEAVRVYSFPAV